MLMVASTTEAQVSSVPKRHRNNNSKEFGNKQRQQNRQQQQKRNDNISRKLEDDISMPLQESGFDVKMMSIPLRSMSIPLHDLRLDLSMPLQELEFDLSMPSQTLEGANTLDDGSDSDGKTVILASFFAGISAFMIGAVALFMKMRQRKAEENGEADDMQVRVVSFAPPSDLNDVEEAASEVVIT